MNAATEIITVNTGVHHRRGGRDHANRGDRDLPTRANHCHGVHYLRVRLGGHGYPSVHFGRHQDGRSSSFSRSRLKAGVPQRTGFLAAVLLNLTAHLNLIDYPYTPPDRAMAVHSGIDAVTLEKFNI